MEIKNKTTGKIVMFVWFVLFPAFFFYMVPEALLCLFGIVALVGIKLIIENFSYQRAKFQNREDRSINESWGIGWSDGSYSWDDGGSGDCGWDGGYGGDCGGGDGGGDCGGGGDGGCGGDW
jgi:uncharacterized membrane protein YgcG